MVPWDYHILRHYWCRLTVVDRTGSYRHLVTKLSGVDSGVPLVPKHFQQGCGFICAQLGIIGDGRCGRARWEGEGGALLCHLIIRVGWTGRVH